MYLFSSKTNVNRKFKLSELYKVMGADKDVKADAKNVLSVTLTNVLNGETLNLPSDKGDTKEIYVFEIVLSAKEVPTLFLAALDKATQFHTVFYLRCEESEMLYGAYKEYGEKGMKIGRYYATEWSEIRETPLPPVTSLDEMYTFFIDELIPISARKGETTRAFVERYDAVIKLKKEIEKLQKLVDKEVQPRRRFEYNKQLKQKKKELEEIE